MEIIFKLMWFQIKTEFRNACHRNLLSFNADLKSKCWMRTVKLQRFRNSQGQRKKLLTFAVSCLTVRGNNVLILQGASNKKKSTACHFPASKIPVHHPILKVGPNYSVAEENIAFRNRKSLEARSLSSWDRLIARGEAPLCNPIMSSGPKREDRVAIRHAKLGNMKTTLSSFDICDFFCGEDAYIELQGRIRRILNIFIHWWAHNLRWYWFPTNEFFWETHVDNMP